ncbi:cathelicidin-related peptide-like [Anolis carolinensis]|uniref:cathelicidin-related peptide-like n=1 Tax=Anolis carolinensis TaxID=28377 RepID=UPI002F2B869B
MERNLFWLGLLVAGLAAAVATKLTYQEAAELAVDLYNRNAGENVTFLLSKVVLLPKWDANSADAQELNFVLKEADCQAEEKKSPKLEDEEEEEEEEEECTFKDNGLVKKCFGFCFLNEEPPAAVLVCSITNEEETTKQPKRVKRFKKFWKKTRRRLRKPLQKAIRTVVIQKAIVVAGKLLL